MSLDGVGETSEGVCFTYASIDKRSWETLWLKTIVITRSLHHVTATDYRSYYHHTHSLSQTASMPSSSSSSPYAVDVVDNRGLTCVIFTRSRVFPNGGVVSGKTQSTVETRRIVTFGDVLALLLHNSSPASPPMPTPATTTAPAVATSTSTSIMDLNLKTPEPYTNQPNTQLSNYPCPPTPMFPDAPNLDYLPPSLPPPPPPPAHDATTGVDDTGDAQNLEDDVISIDESNRGLVIDESTHDDVPQSPTDSRRSSPGLPSPLGADDDDVPGSENRPHIENRQFAFGSVQPQTLQPNPELAATFHSFQSTALEGRSQAQETGKRDALHDAVSIAGAARGAISAGAVLDKLKSSLRSPLSGVELLSRKDNKKVPTSETKRYSCDVCQKTFVWKKSYDHHMKVHSGVREFYCPRPECKRSFSLKKQLVRHLKNQHKATSLFACHSCDKKFMLEVDLQTHLESHGPKKTIKCPYKSSTGCEKTFVSKSLLVIHLRVHTGEKPFKCHICPKAYQQNQHLKEHMYTHSGELPFLCELCSKGFKSQAQLTLHLKMHANDRRFVCHVDGCGKSYVTKALLTKHVKTVHLGERPYLCPYCDKTYPKIYDLKNHIRSHTGERPFQCDVCFKDFAHKVVWRRHMLLHESSKDKKDDGKEKLDDVGGGKNELAVGGGGRVVNAGQLPQPSDVDTTTQSYRDEARINLPEEPHLHLEYETQWRRPEVYTIEPRESQMVDVSSEQSQPRMEVENHSFQQPIPLTQMEDHSESETQQCRQGDNQPGQSTFNQQQPQQLQQPQHQQQQQQQPQQHYHQHPKYRFLRKESAYSPSTLSAYSESTNNEVRPSNSLSIINTDRYATPPPLPPPPPPCAVKDEPSSSNPPSAPSPQHQSPFALAKLRGISLSHALPLPAPSHHALSLPAHHPAIHAIPGYAHPFNYSLCSSFFPPFSATDDPSTIPPPSATAATAAAAPPLPPAGAGASGSIVYQSFVAKSSHSL